MNPFRRAVSSADKTVIPGFITRSLTAYHVDFKIQVRMLIALVILEVLLVTSGVVHLYFRFNAILEEQLYRIHHTGNVSTLEQMLTETGIVIAILLVVNLIALTVADRIWVRYVRSILRGFLKLGYQTIAMDLRQDSEIQDTHRVNHRSVELMLEWRRHEHKRASLIRNAMENLQPDADFSSPEIRTRCLQSLERIRRLLPPYSRRFLVIRKSQWDLD